MKIWLVEHYGDSYYQYTDYQAVFDHKPSLEEVKEDFTKWWMEQDDVRNLEGHLSLVEQLFREETIGEDTYWEMKEMNLLSTPTAPLGSHLQAL